MDKSRVSYGEGIRIRAGGVGGGGDKSRVSYGEGIRAGFIW